MTHSPDKTESARQAVQDALAREVTALFARYAPDDTPALDEPTDAHLAHRERLDARNAAEDARCAKDGTLGPLDTAAKAVRDARAHLAAVQRGGTPPTPAPASPMEDDGLEAGL